MGMLDERIVLFRPPQLSEGIQRCQAGSVNAVSCYVLTVGQKLGEWVDCLGEDCNPDFPAGTWQKK